MGQKFAREIEIGINLTKKCISDVYIDGVCFPYQIMSVSMDDYCDGSIPRVNITIPCGQGRVRGENVSDVPIVAEATAPDAYVALLNENERLKRMIDDQNRKIAILLDT